MPLVLTQSTILNCIHGGTLTLAGTPKLRVMNSNVLLEQSLVAIAGCGNTPPCLTITKVEKGKAAKLKVGGKPVLLTTLQATTNVAPRALVPVLSASQTKLNAGEASL